MSRYPIRQPRLQPPFHTHAYVSQTSKYKLPVLLNSIKMHSDDLTSIIENVDNISLSESKKTSKSYMFDTYSYECINNYYMSVGFNNFKLHIFVCYEYCQEYHGFMVLFI